MPKIHLLLPATLALVLTFSPVAGIECSQNPEMEILDVRFYGLKHTKTWIVERELIHKPGSKLNCQLLWKEVASLEELDIFAKVKPELKDSADQKILIWHLDELPAYLAYPVITKSDEYGISAGAGLASLNFMGRDIRLEINTRFGGSNELQLNAGSPWIGNLPVEYDLTLMRVDSENPFDSFKEQSWYFKNNFWARITGQAAVLFHTHAYWLKADPQSVLLNNPGADWYTGLGTGIRFDFRDRKILPTKGRYGEIRITKVGGFLGGTADYWDWLLDSRYLFPIKKRFHLGLYNWYRHRTGKINENIGIYDDFHLGGANSLRGFPDNHAQGISEHIFYGEAGWDAFPRSYVDWKLIQLHWALRAVLGAEIASAWGNKVLPQNPYMVSMYTGIHLLLPGIEKLRIELGVPLYNPDVYQSQASRGDWRIHVGIWNKAGVQRWRRR